MKPRDKAAILALQAPLKTELPNGGMHVCLLCILCPLKTTWEIQTLSFYIKSSPIPSLKLLSNRRQKGCILLRKGVTNYNLYQQANKSIHLSTFVQRR